MDLWDCGTERVSTSALHCGENEFITDWSKAVDTKKRRTETIQVRVTREDKDLIARAAQESDVDVSAYVTRTMRAAAQDTLAQRLHRTLSPKDFARAQEILEAPAQRIPELAALAAEPSPFADR